MGPSGLRVGSGQGSTMKGFLICNVPPNILRVIEARKLRWAGHVARMEEGMNAFKMLTGKKLLGVDGRTILERTLKR